MQRAFMKLSVVIGIVLLVCLIGVTSLSAPSSFPRGELFIVHSGESALTVAKNLEDREFIRSSSIFLVALRALDPQGGVIAGDYQFDQKLSVIALAQRFSGGRYGTRQTRVTFPEGVSVKTMAEILKKQIPDYPVDEFLALAQPYEGYLFPDTYIISRTITPAVLIQRMRDRFDSQYADLVGTMKANQRDVVIMASILEGESRGITEGRIISGILQNRLRMGMPLQVDAPFMYRYGKGSLDLTLSDLRRDDPYNTYINKGLTPGPIGNPGRIMLEAALDPSETPYLYYLHDREGRVYYAKTYAEHLANRKRAGL
jgi:UPF0755 protein